jgi:hypothetical protein
MGGLGLVPTPPKFCGVLCSDKSNYHKVKVNK